MALKWMYQLGNRLLSVKKYYAQPEVTTAIKEALNTAGGVTTTAASVSVAAGTDGLSAGTSQAALQALATRIQALEDAAP